MAKPMEFDRVTDNNNLNIFTYSFVTQIANIRICRELAFGASTIFYLLIRVTSVHTGLTSGIDNNNWLHGLEMLCMKGADKNSEH